MEEMQHPSEFKRQLNWVDLAGIIGGVIVVYVLLVTGTAWLAGWWPHEKILLYLNGFLTQFSLSLLILGLKKLRRWDWADFGWRKVNLRRLWPGILRLYFLVWVINIVYVIYLYSRGLTPPSTDVYAKLFGNTTILTYVLNVIMASVLAPLVEETLFRGIIFGSLQTYFGKWTAAIISAILFSGLHLQAYGFFPRFVLGLVLAHLYETNRSLYPSMAFHSLNNLIAATLMAGVAP